MDQIVEYARHRTLVVARFRLSDLLTEVLTLLHEPLQVKHLTVETNFLPSADSLQADRDQIAQVLLTVVERAIEASPRGGAIGIMTNESYHHEQRGMMIRVRDAGTGLSGEGLPQAFEPLCTSGKSRVTGLGMTICRHIIERHHGDIRLTSTIGSGTIASIWLPVTQEVRWAASDSMRADICVTDDEPAIREALVKWLTRQGHHAVGYESGEALLAGLQHSLPDLVLLNLKLPGLNGLATLQQVRQLAPAAIVIILTAYGTMEDAVEAITLGADDFLIKSVDLKGLDAVIARALDVLKLRQRLADCTCDLSVWGLGKT
jgi:CheY-like chemotaxis protein